MATSWCAPSTGTPRTRYGSSTAMSTCCPPPRRDNPRVQVTRHRKPAGKLALPARFGARKVRLAIAGASALTLVLTGTGLAFASTHGFGADQVGTTTDKGLAVSDDQYVTPYGDRLVLNNGK